MSHFDFSCTAKRTAVQLHFVVAYFRKNATKGLFLTEIKALGKLFVETNLVCSQRWISNTDLVFYCTSLFSFQK